MLDGLKRGAPHDPDLSLRGIASWRNNVHECVFDSLNRRINNVLRSQTSGPKSSATHCNGILSHKVLPVPLKSFCEDIISRGSYLASAGGVFKHPKCNGHKKPSRDMCMHCDKLDIEVSRLKLFCCQGIDLEPFRELIDAKEWCSSRSCHALFAVRQADGRLTAKQCQVFEVVRHGRCERCSMLFLNLRAARSKFNRRGKSGKRRNNTLKC